MQAGAGVVGRRMYDITDGAAARPAINIGGGASIAQQALRAGPVDELGFHIAPVILGSGRSLFGELPPVSTWGTRVLDSPYAMHVSYRVVK